MTETKAYAALAGKSALVPHTITRREPGPNDVAIEILFSGICHTDVHQVNEDWGPAKFPMVPGHEIVGRVVSVGSGVKDLQAGAAVGVGCAFVTVFLWVLTCSRCGLHGRQLPHMCQLQGCFRAALCRLCFHLQRHVQARPHP
jgi:D-arabinose 1-dehydrogenase-like Zn-dependent alcohol dehydrogenase